MRLKDIANLCGVSISTVSKVINGKADDISQEVKDKVLDTIKKYNYTPYSFTQNSTLKSFTVCFLSRDVYYSFLIINGLIEQLGKSGYSLMVFNSQNDLEIERENILKIASKNIDGFIWEPVSSGSEKNYDLVQKLNCQKLCVNIPIASIPTLSQNFYAMGYLATKYLIEKSHRYICCISKAESLRAKQFENGFKKALFDYAIPFNDNMLSTLDDFDIENKIVGKFTAVICSHFSIACDVYNKYRSLGLNIPSDLSIVSLRNKTRANLDTYNITTIDIPDYELGKYCADQLISMCEDKGMISTDFETTVNVDSNVSVDIPVSLKSKSAIVLGNVNIDYYLFNEEMPTFGHSCSVADYLDIPGGKGLNQAVGIARLKKKVSIISKIGKDGDGRILLKYLNDQHVDCSLVTADEDCHTNRSFISLNSKGETAVISSLSASKSFNMSNIKNIEKYFNNVGFCLIQSGSIPTDVLMEVSSIAHKNNCKIILKPFLINSIDGIVPDLIDIFVPNREEALKLSNTTNIEDAANFFLRCGFKNVIITLDKDGVYFSNNKENKHYEAYPTNIIDQTGASDGFISTLTVMLLDGYDLDSAINAAMISASYCISKVGCSSSMIDKETLDRYIAKYNLVLTKEEA